MYKILRNEESGNYELIRNRDGRILDTEPIKSASIFYPMAEFMATKQPHVTGHLWKAAGIATRGEVDWCTPEDRKFRWAYDTAFMRRARVKSYTVERAQKEASAIAAPLPKPYSVCSCDYYQKAGGRRPLILGKPVCKHILAVVMERQSVENPAQWHEVAQKPRDSYAAIQKRKRAIAESNARKARKDARHLNYAIRYGHHHPAKSEILKRAAAFTAEQMQKEQPF